jgi:hypothetical protein
VWGRRGGDLAGTSDDKGAIVELIVDVELHDGSLDLRNQLGKWERKVRRRDWRTGSRQGSPPAAGATSGWGR